MGMPPLDPPSPYHTRTQTNEHKYEHEHDECSDREVLTSPVDEPLQDGKRECDDDEEEDSGDEEGEYEVERIIAYRRVGKKRGRYEYKTKWKNYDDETWEPSGSFKLDGPDENGNRYLDVYEEFKERMKTNEINENEEVSIDEEEKHDEHDEEEKHDETSNETNRQEEVKNEIRNSIANRIRIL